MRKILLFTLILALSVSILGCTNADYTDQMNKDEKPKQEIQNNAKSDEELVKNLIEEFGSKLKMVSLLAPEDILRKSMQDNYGGLVTQELIEKWLQDPINAPGRLTSSPWPDRIEIISMERLSQDSFKVEGVIAEITANEEIAAKRPIVLTVKKINDKWLIVDVILEPYDENNSISYKNTEYGFSFTLPESWEGYKIINDQWEGLSTNDSQGEKVVEKGPMISIRHPKWTDENPRQDIPIMIFTIKQWDLLQEGKFHIGAAPIGPRELGRNSKYVFALPARYNYAFPEGYEEVEDILKGSPLKPFEN